MTDWRNTFGALIRVNTGWYAMLAAMALTCVAVFAIHTASQGAVETNFAVRHVRNLAISLIVLVACALPHPKYIGQVAYVLMATTLVLLIVLILPFVPQWLVPTTNGVRGWIRTPVMNVQPSELAKITFVLALAWYLRYRNSYRTLRGLLVPFGILLVPVSLILKQPDLGTAILFGPVLFAVLIAAGAKLRHLSALLALAVLAVALNVVAVYFLPPNMQVLAPHQQERIVSTIDYAMGNRQDVQSSQYQQDKSVKMIGAGGVFGYGARRSAMLLQYHRLPERHNDMIFAVIVNRWGVIGGLVVLTLYVILLGTMLAVAARSKDPFAQLSCVGFAALIFTQVVVNIGMTLGLLPIIGITLPFLSYGGSSLLASFAMIGLTMNFASRPTAPLVRPSFEFDTTTEQLEPAA